MSAAGRRIMKTDLVKLLEELSEDTNEVRAIVSNQENMIKEILRMTQLVYKFSQVRSERYNKL